MAGEKIILSGAIRHMRPPVDTIMWAAQGIAGVMELPHNTESPGAFREQALQLVLDQEKKIEDALEKLKAMIGDYDGEIVDN